MRSCAFVLSILISVISTAQTPLIEELQLARKHFELKSFEMARIHFESLEVHKALSVDDVRRLALCYEALGDNESAIDRWHQVIKSENRTPEDLLSLSQMFKVEARYDESLEILEEYRNAGGEMADHYVNSCLFARKIVTNEANCDLENLALNTSSAESGISFYNGDMVYATHRIALDSRFGIKGDMDKRPKTVLLAADTNDPHNGRPIKMQDRKDDAFGFVSYAANGKLMVYVRSDFKADHSGVDEAHDGMSLYYALIDESGAWSKDLAFPFNSTEYDNGFPFVSEDGTALFYSSDMPGGAGGFDLYVSHFENGSWTMPENLGREVNTPGNEITPFLTDGKLYFASDWLPGLGGYDVYSIKNVNNSWNDLSHLGACVNSPSDDFGYVVDPTKKSAYFTSDRQGGKGHNDIYRINDRVNINEIELVSTESVAVPVIITDSKESLLVEASEEAIDSYPSESELKEMSASVDVLKQETRKKNGEVVRLNQLMRHSLIAPEPDVSARDLPDLNFDVIKKEEQEVASVEDDAAKNDEVIPEKQFQRKGALIIEEALRLPMVDVDHAYLNKYSNNEILLEKNDMTRLEKIEVEVDFSKDYMILEDPTIKNMVLAPQEKVYFIQIAALKSYTSNLDRFAHFRRYGNVYKFTASGMVKIRIGYFKTQREAVSVLEDLKKRGIRGAFVVGDILDAGRIDLIASPLDEEEGEVVNLSNTDLVPPYISKYKVRVSSYQWPSQFQTSGIADLGHIEHWTKGPWKIILLSGYSTKGQAMEVLERCKSRGFDDAYIVKDQNGTLERIDL